MISVIVPTVDGDRWLGLCVPALADQATGEPFEIIVVEDGASSETTAKLAREHPRMRIVRSEARRGFAAACNLGARQSRGELLAFLNDDTRPDRRWLSRLAAALAERDDAGMAASLIVSLGGDTIDSAGDGYLRCGAAFKHHHGDPARASAGASGSKIDGSGSGLIDAVIGGSNGASIAGSIRRTIDRSGCGQIDAATVGPIRGPVRETFGACGAAFMLRRTLFEELGGFDEDYEMVHEDVDLSYRARLRGAACLFVPDAIVEHAGSASLGVMSPRAVYLGQRNLEWTYVKNTPASLLWRTLASHVAYGVAAGIGYGLGGHGWTFVKAKAAAAAGLPMMLRKRRAIQRERRVDANEIAALMDRDWILRKHREKRFARERRAAETTTPDATGTVAPPGAAQLPSESGDS